MKEWLYTSKPQTERMFTIEEIANELGICNDTVRRGLKANGFDGVMTNIGLHQNVLMFTYEEYRTFKEAWEKKNDLEENYLTASQVAEMAGCDKSWVSAIACRYKIERIVKPNHMSRVAYYPKESAEKILEIMSEKRAALERRKKDSKTTAPQESIDEEAQHPLVTDKRCLKLSWWPDITPNCFEDLDKETINF